MTKFWNGFKWLSGLFALGGIAFVGVGTVNFSMLTIQHVLAVLLYFSCALLALNIYMTARFAKQKGCKVEDW